MIVGRTFMMWIVIDDCFVADNPVWDNAGMDTLSSVDCVKRTVLVRIQKKGQDEWYGISRELSKS